MATPCEQCGSRYSHDWHCPVRAERKKAAGRKISESMKRSWQLRGVRSDVELEWRAFAGRCVQKAIALGFLPALDGSHACEDCGGVATVYEHRDYTRVIDVVPVCNGCNLRRPRAPMPTVKEFQKLVNRKDG